jgi:hypothetical protein
MAMAKRVLLLFFIFLARCSPAGNTVAVPTSNVSCSPTGNFVAVPTSTRPLVPAVVGENILSNVEDVAEYWNVSTKEALQRIFLEQEVGWLQSQLEDREADTFAGMWGEDKPKFHIVVLFTRDGEETIRPYLEDTHLGGLIELCKARVTIQELIDAQRQASQLVNTLGLSGITPVNEQENRVEIHIADRALLNARLRETGLKIPDHVEVIVGPVVTAVPAVAP